MPNRFHSLRSDVKCEWPTKLYLWLQVRAGFKLHANRITYYIVQAMKRGKKNIYIQHIEIIV